MTKSICLLALLVFAPLPVPSHALAAAPVPRVEKKPGIVTIAFERALGTNELHTSTHTKRFMGDHVVTLHVTADEATIGTHTLGPEVHTTTDAVHGVDITLRVKKASEVPALVDQLGRCQGSASIVPMMPPNTPEKSLRWVLDLSLSADQFTTMSNALAKSIKDKVAVKVDLDATELDYVGCSVTQTWK